MKEKTHLSPERPSLIKVDGSQRGHKNKQSDIIPISESHIWQNQKMGRRAFLQYSLLTVIFLLTGQQAQARGRYCRPVKIGHPLGSNTTFGKWAHLFASRLYEIDNKIELEIISNQPSAESIPLLQNESLDLALVYAGDLARTIPQWRVVSLPTLFPNRLVVKRLRDKGRFIKELGQFMPQNVFLVTTAWEFQSVATKTANIQSPKDLKGKKLRVFDKEHAAMVAAAGANPVFLAYGDLYPALTRGLVDGAVSISETFEQLARERIIKTLTWSSERSILSSGWALLTNQRFWQKTADLQPRLQRIGNDTAAIFEESSQEAAEKAVAVIREAGVKINEMNQDNFNKWVDIAIESSWGDFAESIPKGQKLITLALLDQR